jgi:hypothetical protein
MYQQSPSSKAGETGELSGEFDLTNYLWPYIEGIFNMPTIVQRETSTVQCNTNLRVALAMAPIRTGGMAMMIHPKAATYDNIWALPAVLLDNTLWKYTCNNIVNINTYSTIYGLLSKQIQ